MQPSDGFTQPIWTQSTRPPAYEKTGGGFHAEVVVIGAGISGLTTAYLLAVEGRDVVVLDAGPIGAGQTDRTSAHLTSIIDDRFSLLESRHNVETSRLAYASHAAAIDRIEQIVRDEGIDCDFARVEAYLFAGPAGDEKILEEEFGASQRAGASVERVDAVPSLSAQFAGLKFGAQAIFDPVRYLYALAAAATGRGVRIFCGRRVGDVQGADPKTGNPARVTFHDNEEVITATHVVVATNVPAPINDWTGIYLKQAAYRTYMVGLAIEPGSIQNALYWDTASAYHYARVLAQPQSGRDVLLVGGEDHKTGQGGATPERFENLIHWARSVFPNVGEAVSRWSGQVVETGDGLAFIGRAPTKGENVYCITGDSGMGLTHGTLGAILIADLIAGRTNPWEAIYDPARKLLNRDLVAEALNANAQYTDYLTPGEISNESDLQPGQGALMRQGMTKLAVYRDDSGTVHTMSAVCPHLKCIVHWNGVERSWDCPCHGSRFDCQGRLLVGPSIDDLPSAE